MCAFNIDWVKYRNLNKILDLIFKINKIITIFQSTKSKLERKLFFTCF